MVSYRPAFGNRSTGGESVLPASTVTVKKQFYGIDIAKAVMAVAIIAVHRTPFSGTAINLVAKETFGRLAVAVFFASAGFIFFGKARREERGGLKRLLRYLSRLALLYGIWSLLYLPAALYRFDIGQHGYAGFFLSYLKQCALDAPMIHLWYIPALAVAVSAVFLLLKKLPPGAVFAAGCVLYACYTVLEEFPSLTEASRWAGQAATLLAAFPVRWLVNGLFIGFVFVAAGAFAASKECRAGTGARSAAALLAVGMLLAEVFLVNLAGIASRPEHYLLFVPAAFALLLFVSKADLKEHKVYRWLREMSILVYFSHLLIITEWYDRLFAGTLLAQAAQTRAFLFAFTLAYSLVFSSSVLLLERIKPLRFLKYLH